MTQDEIIRMAREAGIGALTEYGKEALERFAALVAAREREKQAEQEPVAWMNTNGAVNRLRKAGWAMNAAPVSIEAAVLAEREACAKVCDEFGEWRDTSGVDCAAAIRAR